MKEKLKKIIDELDNLDSTGLSEECLFSIELAIESLAIAYKMIDE